MECLWSHKAMWDCRMATRAQRVTMLDRIIPASLSYACQTWHPTVKELIQFRGAQQRTWIITLKLPHIWTLSAADNAKHVRKSIQCGVPVVWFLGMCCAAKDSGRLPSALSGTMRSLYCVPLCDGEE